MVTCGPVPMGVREQLMLCPSTMWVLETEFRSSTGQQAPLPAESSCQLCLWFFTCLFLIRYLPGFSPGWPQTVEVVWDDLPAFID